MWKVTFYVLSLWTLLSCLLVILKACCSSCADSDIFNLLVLSWPSFMETAQKNFLKSDVGNSKVSSQYKLFYLNLNLAKYILGSFLTNVLVRRPLASFGKLSQATIACRVYKSLKADTLFPIRFNTCVGSYLFSLLVKCQCYIIIMTNLLKTFGFLEKITLTIKQRLDCL